MASPCCARRVLLASQSQNGLRSIVGRQGGNQHRSRISRLGFPRFMATETMLPSDIEAVPPPSIEHKPALDKTSSIISTKTHSYGTTMEKFFKKNVGTGYRPLTEVVTTMHRFPTMEPVSLRPYPSDFLHLRLRRDILQRAIIYEGAAHRLGRGKTLHRTEIHGSHRKMRPQKGSGRARLGTKQSPTIKGGGKAHGPKPRDFSIKLPRKMYDLAFRTALSYRYRRQELIVVDNTLEVQWRKTRHVQQIMLKHGWGKEDKRTLFVTKETRPKLWAGLNSIPHHGRALVVGDVDVKDLLESGRVVIEKEALNTLLAERGYHAA